ncbi:MAG: response regulator transcription factor [Deltaproteobacteria bacterium]|jgi:two-component system response regulator CpxR|nr:response regulator transcription factor [Deltaproteobacteria bacterium]
MNNANHILLIDDDVELTELLTDYLKAEGFEVSAAHDGVSGLARAIAGECAMIVLDVMLPGMNGLDVLRKLRAQSQTPVLMLTARGDDIDRIVGLEIGADDYLAKPFNARELVARIRAVLRRSEARKESLGASPPEVTSLVVGDLELVPSSLTCRLDGEVVPLTAAEFALLEVLVKAAGKVVSRDELSEKALGRRLSPYDRSLDVHVSNVRKKLARGSHGSDRIKTVRGTGYLYALDAASGGGS